jgi:nitrogen regulatory protein PII
MKRIEIVVEASRLDAFVAIIGKHATGYTLLPQAAGLGEHGYRERDMVVLVTVVTEDHLDAVIESVRPLLNERASIILVSDVSVVRPEHFIPEVRAASGHSKA